MTEISLHWPGYLISLFARNFYNLFVLIVFRIIVMHKYAELFFPTMIRHPHILKNILCCITPLEHYTFRLQVCLWYPKSLKTVFIYQPCLVWNHLPVQVREADILSTVKSKFKTFLFDKSHS